MQKNKIPERNKPEQNLLRAMALATLLVGAIGSLYFMFRAGSNQKSIALIALFTFWVVSPFAGLFIANKIFIRLAVIARRLVYWSMFALAICSLMAYSGSFKLSGAKPAFIFLVIPFLSWLAILTVLIFAKQLSSKEINGK